MGNLFGDDDEILSEMEDEIGSILDAEEITPDVLEELTPRSNPDLFGHEEIEKHLLNEYLLGRLPHAIILAGTRGIGKATLAYRIAKFLFAQKNNTKIPETFHVSPENPVFKRVVSLGHADILVIEREFDEKREKLKSEIPVDTARKIHPFLQKTAAEGGWRVVIIDGAEALNQNSQNAILKVLEEAPKDALLILTTSQPGAFLPTIRSRCRMVQMKSLSDDVMSKLLSRNLPSLSSADKVILLKMAEGSIGSAIEFYQNNGIQLYKEIFQILETLPRLDMVKLHELAEKLGKSSAEVSYYMAMNIILKFCENNIRSHYRGDLKQSAYGNQHFLSSWESISTLIKNIDNFNLDKRQGIIGAFLTLQNPDYKGIAV